MERLVKNTIHRAALIPKGQSQRWGKERHYFSSLYHLYLNEKVSFYNLTNIINKKSQIQSYDSGCLSLLISQGPFILQSHLVIISFISMYFISAFHPLIQGLLRGKKKVLSSNFNLTIFLLLLKNCIVYEKLSYICFFTMPLFKIFSKNYCFGDQINLIYFLYLRNSLKYNVLFHKHFSQQLISFFYISVNSMSWKQLVKNIPAVRETQVRSLGREDSLEEGMATYSSTPAQRIPWTEEPGGLESTGLHRVGRD